MKPRINDLTAQIPVVLALPLGDVELLLDTAGGLRLAHDCRKTAWNVQVRAAPVFYRYDAFDNGYEILDTSVDTFSITPSLRCKACGLAGAVMGGRWFPVAPEMA